MTAKLLFVIDHSDTQVDLDGHALRVRRPDKPPQHVPLGLLGLVVVHGRALVACDVWRALAEHQVPAVLQPGRGQGACVWMGAALGATGALRTAQDRAAERLERRLMTARRLLSAKLEAQRQAARLVRRANTPEEDLARLFQRLAESRLSLDGVDSLAGLMGQEGAAAAAWYHWLGNQLPKPWGFAGRNRRPPRDPVNALLSLGYTLLGGEMLGAIQEAGLDPARGLLHDLVPGRESLVLDLIEPLRPSVDVVMVSLLDTLLTPEDFTLSQEEGCRLSKAARNRFYQAWAQARQDWPDLGDTDGDHRMDNPPAALSLRQLCRRQTEFLREELKGLMPEMGGYRQLNLITRCACSGKGGGLYSALRLGQGPVKQA